MTPENRRANIADEWAMSDEAWRAAQGLVSLGHVRAAISQYYFAVYHAAVAALLSRDIETQTHAGLKTEFSRAFVRTGLIDPAVGRALRRREEERAEADYTRGIVFTPEDVEEARDEARAFREAVDAMLRSEGWKSEA